MSISTHRSEICATPHRKWPIRHRVSSYLKMFFWSNALVDDDLALRSSGCSMPAPLTTSSLLLLFEVTPLPFGLPLESPPSTGRFPNGYQRPGSNRLLLTNSFDYIVCVASKRSSFGGASPFPPLYYYALPRRTWIKRRKAVHRGNGRHNRLQRRHFRIFAGRSFLHEVRSVSRLNSNVAAVAVAVQRCLK